MPLRRCTIWASLLFLFFPLTSGYAQTTDRPATGLLPRTHWVHEAIRRIDGLGLSDPEAGWSDLMLTRAKAADRLAYAAEEAERRGMPVATLLRGYVERFAEEFPTAAESVHGVMTSRAPWTLDAVLFTEFDDRDGQVLAGTGYRNDGSWTGPRALDRLSTGSVGFTGSLSAPSFLTMNVKARYGRDGVELDEGYAMVAWRKAALLAGRYSPAFGLGVHGGLVLNGDVAVDGVALLLTEPIRMPGFLRHLGPIRMHTFLSQLEQNRYDRPWLWGTRGSIQPHPRLSLGVNRAVIFGGDGNGAFTLKNLTYIAIGKHAGQGSEYDNQIVSLDIRYAAPIERLPMLFYLEWGLEDSAGAWKDVPGVTAGVEVASVPGLPQLAMGLERTSFAESCCGNPIWYRHWSFREGWTDGGRLLGHPLGGHGTEWLAHARLELLESRLRVVTRYARRDRGAENLFAPLREGESQAVWLEVDYRPVPWLEARVRADREEGRDGWVQSAARAGLRFYF